MILNRRGLCVRKVLKDYAKDDDDNVVGVAVIDADDGNNNDGDNDAVNDYENYNNRDNDNDADGNIYNKDNKYNQ